MEFRTFGDTDLKVSAISLGCWVFGVNWWGDYSDDDAMKLMRSSRDQGITYFDCGDAYGNGRAESLLGRFVEETGRETLQIGSKFGYDFYNDPGVPGSHKERKQDFSPKFMRFALEQSLTRLRTDCIDIYLAHNIKLPQFNDELFAELEKVKDEGKIKLWGVALGPAIGWRDEGVDALLNRGAKAVHTVYNLFEQDPAREFCEAARTVHAGVLARVHDNSGVLKDLIKPDMVMSDNDHRRFRDQSWKQYGPQKVEKIRHYAADHQMTIHQLACSWLLSNPTVTAITGTFVNEKEVKEAVESLDKTPLNRAELDQLASDYDNDWGLGEGAHPCDLKSSTAAEGKVRSGYRPLPVAVA
jgi:aryl-alcohol dehydrogenase-like predicted oxidoreductase